MTIHAQIDSEIATAWYDLLEKVFPTFQYKYASNPNDPSSAAVAPLRTKFRGGAIGLYSSGGFVLSGPEALYIRYSLQNSQSISRSRSETLNTYSVDGVKRCLRNADGA
jgi:hypothetical protein